MNSLETYILTEASTPPLCVKILNEADFSCEPSIWFYKGGHLFNHIYLSFAIS